MKTSVFRSMKYALMDFIRKSNLLVFSSLVYPFTKRNVLVFSSLVCLSTCFLACNSSKKTYTIGVSQCSEDNWRDKLNGELRDAA